MPNVGKGAMYKYEVCGADGIWRQKADPLARHTQVPPERASVVWESEYHLERRRVDHGPRRSARPRRR